MSVEIDLTGYDFQRPLIVPVSHFSDGEMILFAAKRNRVQLQDGRTATLIRWTTPRRTSQVRVQFFSGGFLTLKKAAVVAVLVEPLEPHQALATTAPESQQPGGSHDGNG